MTTPSLLSRLGGVKAMGLGRWIARCPAHEDKRPSLSVRELEDGRILLFDFGGCDAESVLGAIGLGFEALFPEREIQHGKPERRPFPASDVLRCLAFEALVVATAGAALLTGHPPFTQTDRARLMLAVGRIQEALTAAGVDHG